jgi:muramoyltetrapeptide carboxypeptidase
VGEQYYHIDRMMQSLRLSGVFEKINGLVVGGMTEMEDQKPPFGKTSEEIIAETVKSYDFPVVFGFPAGHQKNNLPIILGGTVALEASAEQVKIRFQ